MKKNLFGTLAGALLLTLASDLAWAQQAVEESVLGRARPDYDPIGIELFAGDDDPGAPFLLFPRVDAGVGISDNVFKTEHNEESDYFTYVKGSADVVSDWDNHSFSFGGYTEFKRWNEEQRNNHTDFEVHTAGSLDVLLDTAVYGTASYGRYHEERTDPNNLSPSDNVTQYFRGSETIGLSYNSDGPLFLVEGQFNQYDFQNNGTIDNSDRDYDHNILLSRLGYEFQPGVTVFVEPAYNWRRYERNPDDNGYFRDSEGWSLLGGIDYDVSGVTYVEATGGYFKQYYDDQRFPDVQGWNARGALTWNPDEIFTVTADVSRDVKETALANFSSAVDTSAGVGLDWEILENLILASRFRYTDREFEAAEGFSDREDDMYQAHLELIFLINEYLRASLSYDYLLRESDAPNQDIQENSAFFKITAQM